MSIGRKRFRLSIKTVQSTPTGTDPKCAVWPLFHDGGSEEEEHPPTDSVAFHADTQLSSGDLPFFDLDRTVTPTDVNPMGVKGVGEAGTIGTAHTIVNAVVDALEPLGVKHVDMPLRPKRVWAAIQEARA